jgi:hypothetical protein
MAVWRGFGGQLRREHTSRGRSIVNYDRLSQPLGKARGKQARNEIRTAAGRKWNQYAHRSRGISACGMRLSTPCRER